MSSPFALTAEEKRQLEVGYKKPPAKKWMLEKKKTVRIRLTNLSSRSFSYIVEEVPLLIKSLLRGGTVLGLFFSSDMFAFSLCTQQVDLKCPPPPTTSLFAYCLLWRGLLTLLLTRYSPGSLPRHITNSSYTRFSVELWYSHQM